MIDDYTQTYTHSGRWMEYEEQENTRPFGFWLRWKIANQSRDVNARYGET